LFQDQAIDSVEVGHAHLRSNNIRLKQLFLLESSMVWVMSTMSVADVILDVFQAVERRDEGRQRQLFDPEVEFLWPPSLPYRGSTWETVWARCNLHPRSGAWTLGSSPRPTRKRSCCGTNVGSTEPATGSSAPVLGLYRVLGGKLVCAQMFYFDTTATATFLNRAFAEQESRAARIAETVGGEPTAGCSR
jgi:hypothetical protein